MAKTKPGGLGRGLGALLQSTEPRAEEVVEEANDEPRRDQAPDGSYYAEIPVDKVVPNPHQPRQVFDEAELDELVASVKEVGLLQPVVVRERSGGYELIMGERRLRAHKIAGLAVIPAIVRKTDDADMLRDALLENLHRAQLNPLEEAAAYRQLLDDFDCSQEELSQRIKRSRPHISNTMRLLTLPGPVQRRVAAGVLSAGHARAILKLDDPAAQERLAQRIVAEGLSVRGAEEEASLTQLTGWPSPARRRQAKEVPAYATAHADRLAHRLDTKVQIQVGARKGKVTIEFADADDLDRIMELLER
ncbi:ParB-like partition protein [Propionibacterium sp. oral taxon 192 str. F0372]|uniref:ParB/RepB/Spo0J family partition protein n=1 Tax=Propionibacterium sp. oral taxon 192 TaxID=671222 RepID=UPI000353AA0B|nr:ParB/RepB/Spo0J family partition protein [Propionibacterium sp. oral taxon 192]EPH06228.1 ParB-like partition protein [Propionibacterium sp. oral taxon 192 str. F0372]